MGQVVDPKRKTDATVLCHIEQNEGWGSGGVINVLSVCVSAGAVRLCA